MNKLYVTKSTILQYLERHACIDNLERDIKIEKVFSADCRVTDTWAANFLADLNKEERTIRQDYFSKKLSFTDANLSEQMISRAETLISMYQNNNDVFDIWAAKKILAIDTDLYLTLDDIAKSIREKLIKSFE